MGKVQRLYLFTGDSPLCFLLIQLRRLSNMALHYRFASASHMTAASDRQVVAIEV